MNGWGPSNIDKIWAKRVMSSRGEEEEQRGGEGKGGEQSKLDEGFICSRTYSTGSWHEPVLKVLEGAHTDNILPPPSLVPVRGTNRC